MSDYRLFKHTKSILTIFFLATFLLGFLSGWRAKPSINYINLNVDDATHTTQAPWNFEITRILSGEIFTEKGHNVYTTIGKKFERNLKGFHNVTQNSTSGYLWGVSLSNDASPAATWTELTGEASTAGATRKAFDTITVINATSMNGTVTFTFTGSITLQCAGIQWDSHSMDTGFGDSLYAAFAFTQTPFNAADKLIVRYYNQESGT